MYLIINGEGIMRNIDTIIEDARICITISDSLRSLDLSGIPNISDDVSLGTDSDCSLVVEVYWISENRNMFRGKVVRDYYPAEEMNQIDIGTMVEFSNKKISCIFKK